MDQVLRFTLLIPAIKRQRVSSRSAWSTQEVPGQLGLEGDLVSKKEQQKILNTC